MICCLYASIDVKKVNPNFVMSAVVFVNVVLVLYLQKKYED